MKDKNRKVVCARALTFFGMKQEREREREREREKEIERERVTDKNFCLTVALDIPDTWLVCCWCTGKTTQGARNPTAAGGWSYQVVNASLAANHDPLDVSRQATTALHCRKKRNLIFIKHIHSLDCRNVYLPCLSYSFRGFHVHITTVGICEFVGDEVEGFPFGHWLVLMLARNNRFLQEKSSIADLWVLSQTL